MTLLFAITEHGGRRPGVPYAPVDMEHDYNRTQIAIYAPVVMEHVNNRTNKSTAITLNIHHQSSSLTSLAISPLKQLP